MTIDSPVISAWVLTLAITGAVVLLVWAMLRLADWIVGAAPSRDEEDALQ